MRFPLFVALCALPALLAAQEPAVPAKKVTVLIKPAKPFAFDKGGAPAGYSIDLWKRVAEEAKLDYEFKTASTVPEAVDILNDQHAEGGLGALSIAPER